MPDLLDIPDIIEIGQVSTYLAANYTSKKELFGGSVIKPVPPVQIAFVTDGLSWGYSAEGVTAASRKVANYLYWLCGKFSLQAQSIIAGGGTGGSVIPIPPGGGVPYPLDFIVSASSFIATGDSSVVISNFIGYNIEFTRNGVVQYTTDPGDGNTYYTWDRTTGTFTLVNGAAVTGEQFRIIPSR